MAITLYYMQESPPCNSVLITLDLLKINYEKKSIDLSKGEHLTGDLKKVNCLIRYQNVTRKCFSRNFLSQDESACIP